MSIKNSFKQKKGKYIHMSKINILARTACLGGKILTFFDNVNVVEYCAKHRVDYILDCLKNPTCTVQYDILSPLIKVDDIRYYINAEKNNFLGYKNIDMIFMDSFSELADKKFLNRKIGFEFCACIQDIKIDNVEFSSDYEVLGSISLEEIKNYYREFLININHFYGEIPIIFINFSPKYESRVNYIKRANIIAKAIKELSLDFPNLYPIELEDKYVQYPKDGILYHYSEKTYKKYAFKIKNLNLGLHLRSKFKEKLKKFVRTIFSVTNQRTSLKKQKIIRFLGAKIIFTVKEFKRKNIIDFKDITVIVQGPVYKSTSQVICSIKKYLPGAKIILSTWEGENIEGISCDRILFNKDPKSYICNKDSLIYTNINRQLKAIQNAFQFVKTKYAMKLRSDLYLTDNKFLEYFDDFPVSNANSMFFKHRVIVSSLTSKLYSDFPGHNDRLLPFHVSDWFLFGLTEDVKDYFSTPLIENEKCFSQYFYKYPQKNPVPSFAFRYAPEQFFCYNWAKKYIDINFDDWTDYNDENQQIAQEIYANNFIFLDTIQHGLYSNKHLDFIKKNDGNTYFFNGYITHLYFLNLYKNFCDENFEIPKKYVKNANTKIQTLINQNFITKEKLTKRKGACKLIKFLEFIFRNFIILLLQCIQVKKSHFTQNKEYDLIIPFTNCKPTYYLKKHNLRKHSFPLDWMYNFDVTTIIKLFNCNFDNFMKKVKIYQDIAHSSYHSIIDINNNVVSMHHFQKFKDFTKESKRLYDLMQKKFKTLDYSLKNAKKLCLVMCFPTNKHFEELKKCLYDKYPNIQTIDIINIQNNEKIYPSVILKLDDYSYMFNDKYQYNNPDYDWVGNEFCWDYIISQLKTSKAENE